MKHFLLLISFSATAAFAAAPASLAGRVFRNFVADNYTATTPTSRIEYYENTIILSADGSYHCVASAYGKEQDFGPRETFITDPLPDGTYTYTRIDDSKATLILRNTNRSLLPRAGSGGFIDLVFTSDSAGTVTEPFGLFTKIEYFSISEVASVQSAPASNLSFRGRVAGTNPLIAGFVIPGTAQREVLIRVVGPSLVPLGVNGVWADPDFKLFRGAAPATTSEGILGDWSSGNTAGLRRVFDYIGAFPLLNNSKDAVAVVRPSPGAYTIVCNPSPGDPGGEALVEVYFLP